MSIEITRLPSGLTVATDTMPGVATVSLGAWIGAGTRHEAAPLNGIAHLLEHMVFKGTDRRSAQDIAEEIEAVGGQLNAYTSRENTAFYAKVLAEDAALALDVVADILQHPTFLEDELDRERAVVLQEIGQAYDTPDDIVFDYFQETAYPAQALGRPVLGESRTVCGLDRTALRDYLHTHYGPQQMVVAAAGRIEHDRFVDMAASAFAHEDFACNGATDPAAYAAATAASSETSSRFTCCSGSTASATWTTTTTRSRRSPPCSAAACPRGCSRRCARSAASSIRSTPSIPPSSTAASSASMPEPERRRFASWCRWFATSSPS
jgi:predicted Zn-dependent peptidase